MTAKSPTKPRSSEIGKAAGHDLALGQESFLTSVKLFKNGSWKSGPAGAFYFTFSSFGSPQCLKSTRMPDTSISQHAAWHEAKQGSSDNRLS